MLDPLLADPRSPVARRPSRLKLQILRASLRRNRDRLQSCADRPWSERAAPQGQAYPAHLDVHLGLLDIAQLPCRRRPGPYTVWGSWGSELQTAVQKLYAFIELAEVHIAEAQVLEKIGIFGILAVEPLQINAASSRRPAARSRRVRRGCLGRALRT